MAILPSTASAIAALLLLVPDWPAHMATCIDSTRRPSVSLTVPGAEMLEATQHGRMPPSRATPEGRRTWRIERITKWTTRSWKSLGANGRTHPSMANSPRTGTCWNRKRPRSDTIPAVTRNRMQEHFEFSICDAAEIDDPDGVVSQECFSMYALTRASDDGDASPIDPDYTGRLRRIQPSLVAKHRAATTNSTLPRGQALARPKRKTGFSCPTPTSARLVSVEQALPTRKSSGTVPMSRSRQGTHRLKTTAKRKTIMTAGRPSLIMAVSPTPRPSAS